MKRKTFLKQLVFTGASFSILQACNTVEKCTETPTGEEGPFPTKEPATLLSQKIVSDRVGTALGINIIIYNINDNCKVIKDAVVDIWHCDSKGEYSEYGGAAGFPPNGDRNKDDAHRPPPPPGDKNMNDHNHPPPHNPNDKPGDRRPPMGGGSMQSTDYTAKHFLRGRQSTNEKGLASFTSIFPGWYPGRAPHVHAHIFDKNGKSLLITQIAFPENITQQVYAEGSYKAHGQPDTSNPQDHVFNDSIANELASVTGNNKDGYVLTHSIYVKA